VQEMGYLVLAEEFENISNNFAKLELKDKAIFYSKNDSFILHKVKNKTEAEIILSSSEYLKEHSAVAVGFFYNKDQVFLICKKGEKNNLEKNQYSESVILRLAKLHSSGLGCGGLSSKHLEISNQTVKISNPAKIFVAEQEESLFYEVVYTLAMLVKEGYADKSQLPRLASLYINYSPVCRLEIYSYLKNNNKKVKKLNEQLAKISEKVASYI